ncbi:ribonuclease H-like domain-containing protein [Lutibacter sp. B2]|nr:ribonuclease H-like domain-containing protein [Lutibacter sp. B2]
MEIIKYTIKENLTLPQNFLTLYANTNFALFDIETTGLSREHSHIILIGVLYVENNSIIIEQFFCNNRSEEKEMLISFIEKIKQFPLLINYNGNTFDIPFLNKRFKINNINHQMGTHNSIDLLKIVRKNQKKLGMKNCKLKTLEEFLGIYRNDTISGKDSVDLYNVFEESQNKNIKDMILLHNHDDLYYLAKALKILDEIPYDQLISVFPQIFNTSDETIGYIINQSIKRNVLSLEGSYTSTCLLDYMDYQNAFDLAYNKATNTFCIKIPLYKGYLPSGEKCLYISIDDFDFPKENEFIKNTLENILIVKENNNLSTLNIHKFSSLFIPYIFNTLDKKRDS